MRVESLKKEAIKAVKTGKVKITPKSFEKIYFDWLENLRDWNISRQIVWGIQIPAYQCKRKAISDKRQAEWFVSIEKPEKCKICGECRFEQDKDTLDTWFSSGQWPYLTLITGKPGDFEKFYPTSVMETAYDILKAWVSRMVMMGIYLTGDVPFGDVLFHGLVNDPYGKKMSKSKGNVVNPLELVEKYGADAVRFALVYGNATGNDQALSYPKLDAARKFTNKLWNMARFIEMNRVQSSKFKVQSFEELLQLAKNENDRAMIEKVSELAMKVTKDLDNYNFNYAAEALYEFIWHEFADIYIEDVKNRIDDNSFIVLSSSFIVLLKLLHPFMPYVTEEIYQRMGAGESIMIDKWSYEI